MSRRIQISQRDCVVFTYRNHKGETSQRACVVHELRFGTSQWHPEAQWLLEARDFTRGEVRTFAVKDVVAWREAPPELLALISALGEIDQLKEELAKERKSNQP